MCACTRCPIPLPFFIKKKRNLIGTCDFGITGMSELYINENLTHKRKFFAMAYKLKVLLKYQLIWSANGDIFMRKNANCDKIKIANEEDIKSLKRILFNCLFL